MPLPQKLSELIFDISSSQELEKMAMELFEVHFAENEIYNRFCILSGKSPANVLTVENIPFLPVNVFRHQQVLLNGFVSKVRFETSGTTASDTGVHHIADPELYLTSATKGFERFYGGISEYTLLALLPGYLERQHSSLVYMVRHFIEKSQSEHSGFYLNEHAKLFETLKALSGKNKKTLLIGVTHALVDFADKYSIHFPELIVMETGGMKGRRKELSRSELHIKLKKSFGVPAIHSEYGMTELLSQSYSTGNGIFYCPPWMRVRLRDINDPMSPPQNKKAGAINIIDLANMYSCPFLATDDIGVLHDDGSFEINGRMDFSIVRGCNTMIK